MDERYFLGLAPDRDGAWYRVNGAPVFEPTPDPLPAIRERIFEAQRREALRQHFR